MPCCTTKSARSHNLSVRVYFTEGNESCQTNGYGQQNSLNILCGSSMQNDNIQWSVAVHAGSGSARRGSINDEAAHCEGLRVALQAAIRELDSDDTELLLPERCGAAKHVAAAVAAVEALEDNHLFNAGSGAVLTDAGTVENEACVMDGRNLRVGAVAGLSTVVNPVRLALLIQLRARYQFLGFQAAEHFADQFPGLIARQANDKFIVEKRRLDQQRRASLLIPQSQLPRDGETVGAVVYYKGDVACATSTGGVSNKMVGRIGDTPVVGSGSYAANGVCALSGTGIGEEFLKLGAASRISNMVEYAGYSLTDAIRHVVHARFPNDTGGFIGVSSSGDICMDGNSPYFARGYQNSAGSSDVALWVD